MDRFVASFASECDADLELCHAHGVAYQRDQSHLVPYDSVYFAKCAGYEDQDIAVKINAGRVRVVNSWLSQHASVCDIGIGSGEFIKKRPHTFGRDVNPAAISWLKANGLWASRFDEFAGYTFWDVIEHVPTPEDYFRDIRLHAFLFTSIPVFRDLAKIRDSKHYRPGEHLYYFTEQGFVDWMALHGFQMVEQLDFETRAGRESIATFAFKRTMRPPMPGA